MQHDPRLHRIDAFNHSLRGGDRLHPGWWIVPALAMSAAFYTTLFALIF